MEWWGRRRGERWEISDFSVIIQVDENLPVEQPERADTNSSWPEPQKTEPFTKGI